MLFLGALSVFVLSRFGDPEAPAPAVSVQETVAILPFLYQGRQEDQWTGSGLASLLSGVLSSGVFVPVDHPSVRSMAEDLQEEGLSGPSLYGRVAREVGADLVIHGDLVGQPGGMFSANAYIFDPRLAADVGRTFFEDTDFSALAEGLAVALLLERSEADPTLKHDLPTESYEALGAFIEGDREFQAGRYPQARALFETAVELDPGYAIAHYRLSQAALWAWDWITARRAAEDAWSLVSELTDQNRRLLEAWRAFLRSEPIMAEARYRGLLEAFPQNVEVLAGLGSVLLYYNSLRGGRSEEAIPFFRRALEANPKYGEVRYHVLEAAAREGDRAEFDRWYAGLNPESDQALAFETLRSFRWGNPEDQERVRLRLDAATEQEVVYAVGRLAASLHDFSGARRLGELLTAPHRQQELRFAAHGLFAALAFGQGQWTEAQLELDRTAQGEASWSLEMRGLLSLFELIPVSEGDLRGLRDSIQVWDPSAYEGFTYRELFGPHSTYHREFRAYLLGLLSARLGDWAAARESRELIRSFGRSQESRTLVYYLSESVHAHLEHARGNSQAALTVLEGLDYFPPFEFIFASPFFSHALDRWLRASLLRELGRLEEALDWYATLSDGWGEFLFAAPAHLRQAQIHEELGNLAEATAHYERFEALWGHADPDLRPLVEQARAAREHLLPGGSRG
jgi:tetratricopeptide (TPR) repeat protein